MVLLIERLNKFYFKLENLHHHHHQHPSDALLASSLQAFRSDVSNFISQLRLKSEPGTGIGIGIISLSWIQQCFELLSFTNRAFAKLAVDIDYHMREWKAKSVEEYLDFTLSLLDHLNSVGSSLSHLGHARLLLSHALSQVESSSSSGVERLKDLEYKTLSKDFKPTHIKEAEEERTCSDKEWVISQALVEVKSIEFWVSSVVLAALSGDPKPYLEMRKTACILSINSLVNLDNRIYEMVVEKGVTLKEVRELNEGAAGLADSTYNRRDSDAVHEMHSRLNVFEELLHSFRKEVDHLFSQVMTGRNELLDSIRHWKQ